MDASVFRLVRTEVDVGASHGVRTLTLASVEDDETMVHMRVPDIIETICVEDRITLELSFALPPNLETYIFVGTGRGISRTQLSVGGLVSSFDAVGERVAESLDRGGELYVLLHRETQKHDRIVTRSAKRKKILEVQ